MLAHDCARLRITVDALALYRERDQQALVYLGQVRDMVAESDRKANEDAERKAKK